MAFRFNFGSEEERTPAAEPESSHIPCMEAKEIVASEIQDVPESWACDKVRVSGSLTLLKYTQPEVELASTITKEQNLSHSEGRDLQDSDLIPGVYEGGFKLWECSVDLLCWLQKPEVTPQPPELHGMRVLEAGCGTGLPGIYALANGATVHFQDYNEEVLRRMTLPNLQVNGLLPAAQSGRARFFAGDWGSLDGLLNPSAAPEAQYDLILTSDTIYSTSSQAKLWGLITRHLKEPTGMALVAQKSYYFGVGGSIADFCELINASSKFQYKLVEMLEDGKSNRREILQITFVSHLP